MIIVNPLEGMKKTFAIFLYDGKKNGFEAYSYIRDTITDSPVVVGEIEFKEMFNQAPDNFTELHTPIRINGNKYAGQYTFYKRGNGFKEIVLAERINNQPQTKKGTSQ